MGDDLRQHLLRLREQTRDWTQVSITSSLRESTIDQLTTWLDENCTGMYYYDTLDVSWTRVDVRFERPDDATFFKICWENWTHD